MSARSALTPVCRTLTAPIRASPIAGPSRIPLPTLRRSLQTDADASTPKASPEHLNISKLVVRTSQPLTSVLQAYAVLRSIESTYGQVIDFDVVRDTDSLQPTNTLFFTMAEPVNLGKEKETFHEIPSPKSSTGVMERYGGPSLDDVRGILRESFKQLPMSSRGKQSQESITFKVEIRRKAGRGPPLSTKKTTPTTLRQDRKVLEALGKFGDGFFGGFKGLEEKHSKIVEKKQGGMRTNVIDKRDGQAGRQGVRREAGASAAVAEEGVEESSIDAEAGTEAETKAEEKV
jgi:hypothetical protein